MAAQNSVNSFRDLKVWQHGMALSKAVYAFSRNLPKEEVFGLISQMRRASISVPSNIAEGRSRGTRKDFAQFLHIALGSLAELETQILLSQELYPSLETAGIVNMIHEEQKMLSGLLKSIKTTNVVPKT